VQIPDGLRYTENHEWVSVADDGKLRVGITDFAQDALGDVVFVDLPEVGTKLVAGAEFAEVESTKSVSDVYAPVGGSVVEANADLADNPEIINADPYGAGWFIVIEPEPGASLEGLMTADAYRKFIE